MSDAYRLRRGSGDFGPIRPELEQVGATSANAALARRAQERSFARSVCRPASRLIVPIQLIAECVPSGAQTAHVNGLRYFPRLAHRLTDPTLHHNQHTTLQVGWTPRKLLRAATPPHRHSAPPSRGAVRTNTKKEARFARTHGHALARAHPAPMAAHQRCPRRDAPRPPRLAALPMAAGEA